MKKNYKVVIKIPIETMELHAREIEDILDECNVSLGELDNRIEFIG